MKKRIMIADDSRSIVKAVKKVLETEGFEVITAYSGEDCLTKLKKEKPDLILLDILMSLSGVEVLKSIMKLNPKANVIMLTVMGEEPVIKECRRLGAKDFITKPFDNKELVQRVKQALGE